MIDDTLAADGYRVFSADEFKAAAMAAPRSGRRPLLVFDQFEELITLFEEAPDSKAKYEIAQTVQLTVIRTLSRLLLDTELPVKFIFVFREDYHLKLGKFFERIPGLREQCMYLEPLPTAKLRRLIRDPFVLAAAAGKPFDREIDDSQAKEIAAAIDGYSGSHHVNLTEVQIICQTLWRDSQGATRFAGAADKVQEIQTLLERYTDERIAALPEGLRGPAVAILSRLITSSGTRNIVTEPDIVESLEKENGIAPDVARQALGELVGKGRLVNRQVVTRQRSTTSLASFSSRGYAAVATSAARSLSNSGGSGIGI